MTKLTSRPESASRALAAQVRPDFPILAATFGGRPLVYLDNAATAQKPTAVLDAITGYYTTANSNVGRGYYQLSMASTDQYEQARESVRAALNAEHTDEIVFTSGTTASLNLLADTLGQRLVHAGGRVVVTGMEHNSNLLPWRRLCEQTGAELVSVPTDRLGRIDSADIAAALDARVGLVAVAHVSNVLGTVNPVAEIVSAAHRAGIPVVVDGAQAVAHRPIDVRALDADFYCFSGHKVYGPMGIGVLYGKRELLAELEPYQVGGGTVKGVSVREPVRYVPVPARLEAGTPHVAGAIGLAAALRYVAQLGWERIRGHDELLVGSTVAALSELDRVRVVGDPAAEPSGIVSFTVDGIHPYDVGGHLDRYGVAVRSGVHCANTFLDSLGLLGTVRISLAVYNTEEEINLVRHALSTVKPGYWTAEHPNDRFV